MLSSDQIDTLPVVGVSRNSSFHDTVEHLKTRCMKFGCVYSRDHRSIVRFAKEMPVYELQLNDLMR